MNQALFLETPRLLLRQWRDEDLPFYAAMCADAEVMRYFPPLPEGRSTDDLPAKMREHIERHGWGFWVVQGKADGAFLGTVGLYPLRQELAFAPGVEIGWRLARPFWGKGYATEAASKSLEFAFTVLGLDAVLAYAVPANGASIAVMKRIGMRDTGSTFDHPLLEADSPFREHCLYRISSEEWRSRQA